MDANHLKQVLIEYIEQADEKAVQLMYDFLAGQEIADDNSEVPEAHKQIVNERLAEYRQNPQDTVTLEEMKQKYGYT